MSGQPAFMTQRSRILKMYETSKQEFNASTKPYKSTGAFLWTILNPITYNSVANAVAFAVLQPQTIEFFGYGLGDTVPGFPGSVANDADTNLSKARSTNGAEDFVIEGMSISCRGNRIQYQVADWPAGVTVASDPSIVGLYAGTNRVLDPGSVLVPPQVQSPFNLEETLMSALAPNVSIEFEWDRSMKVPIGTMDQIPEGGAKSFLRANGDPETNNRYRIPEGYLWRRDGQPDCEFIARAVVQKPVVVPLSLVALTGTGATKIPVVIGTDVVMRVHGLSVKIPGKN